MRASICDDYGQFCIACMVVSKAFSFVGDLFSLVICSAEAMRKKSILEVHFGALKSTLLPNNSHIGKLEPQLASKNLEFDAPAAELESNKRRLHFAEDVASLMWEQFRSQRPQLRKVEPAHIAANAARAAAESNIQSVTVSESALQGEVD